MSARRRESMRDGDCKHDWRFNPGVVLTSNPPQRQLICVLCGERASSGMSINRADNEFFHLDWPETWPKWDGEVIA